MDVRLMGNIGIFDNLSRKGFVAAFSCPCLVAMNSARMTLWLQFAYCFFGLAWHFHSSSHRTPARAASREESTIPMNSPYGQSLYYGETPLALQENGGHYVLVVFNNATGKNFPGDPAGHRKYLEFLSAEHEIPGMTPEKFAVRDISDKVAWDALVEQMAQREKDMDKEGVKEPRYVRGSIFKGVLETSGALHIRHGFGLRQVSIQSGRIVRADHPDCVIRLAQELLDEALGK